MRFESEDTDKIPEEVYNNELYKIKKSKFIIFFFLKKYLFHVELIIKNLYNSNTMIFVGKNNKNWMTLDCLQKVRAMNHGRPVEEF